MFQLPFLEGKIIFARKVQPACFAINGSTPENTRQNVKTETVPPAIACRGLWARDLLCWLKRKIRGIQGRLAPRWDLFLDPGKTGKIGYVSVDSCYLTHARWHQTHLSTDGSRSVFPREVSAHQWVPNSSYLVLDSFLWHRTLIGSYGNSNSDWAFHKGKRKQPWCPKKAGCSAMRAGPPGLLSSGPATRLVTFILSRHPGVLVASHSPALREGIASLATEQGSWTWGQLDHSRTSFHAGRLKMGFPGGSVVKKKKACQCRRLGFNPWEGKSPWKRKWPPTPVFLPGKSHSQRSLAGCSPWGRKRVGHCLVTAAAKWL